MFCISIVIMFHCSSVRADSVPVVLVPSLGFSQNRYRTSLHIMRTKYGCFCFSKY